MQLDHLLEREVYHTQHCGRVMYLDRFSYNPIELAIFGVVKNKLHKYLVLWYCTYLRTYLPKKNGDG